jgi:hypothetical protein
MTERGQKRKSSLVEVVLHFIFLGWELPHPAKAPSAVTTMVNTYIYRVIKYECF